MEYVPVKVNKEIDKYSIPLSELTRQKLVEKFFDNNGRALYVCSDGKFVGIVTLGRFLENIDIEEQWVNTKCFFVPEGNAELAQEIFRNNANINQIPILGAEKRVVGEVERNESIANGIGTKEREMIVDYFNLMGKHAVFGERIENFKEKADIYIVSSGSRKIIAERMGMPMVEEEEKVLALAYNFFLLYEIAKRLKEKGIPLLYFARPSLKSGYLYSEKARERIAEKLTFNKVIQEYDKYQEVIKLLYGDGVSREYIKEISNIPPIVKMGKRTYHVDLKSPYVNVISGKRITKNQPYEAQGNIYVYGRCGVFGYAVCDDETIPSVLQKRINEASVRFCVVNNGLWGADTQCILNNLNQDIEVISNSDIVILYMQPLSDKEQKLIMNEGMKYIDCTDIFHSDDKVANAFFDKPGHMNADGYSVIANYIYKTLSEYGLLNQRKKACDKSKPIRSAIAKEPQIEKYIADIKRKYAIDYDTANIGAIVMNCNPCTNGHLHLIEYAAKTVDYLFVFVVEEDKSMFPFKERIELVRKACNHLKNIIIVGSGKFMISTLTFPDYFEKETRQELIINPIKDIEIFGQSIANELNIRTRFAGEEPMDMVTQQYNIMMKRELPHYGIRFVEIPRKQIEGTVVSASTVRRLSAEGKWEDVRKLVPSTTYSFLVNWFRKCSIKGEKD